MSALWVALTSYAGAAFDWFGLRRNRRKAYRVARFVLPLLVGAGLVTNGTAGQVLGVLAVIAGFGVPHLAARHT